MFDNPYKTKAEEVLRECNGKAILLCILFSVINSVAASILWGLGGLVASGILSYGLSYAFLNVVRHRDLELGDLFEGIKTNPLNNIFSGLLVSLMVTLYTMLLIVPGIIKSYAYTMVFYVLNDNPELGPLDALHESERIMDGHKMEFFMVQLSFIGWILLTLITFGIAGFWLVPRMEAAKAAFYEDIKHR